MSNPQPKILLCRKAGPNPNYRQNHETAHWFGLFAFLFFAAVFCFFFFARIVGSFNVYFAGLFFYLALVMILCITVFRARRKDEVPSQPQIFNETLAIQENLSGPVLLYQYETGPGKACYEASISLRSMRHLYYSALDSILVLDGDFSVVHSDRRQASATIWPYLAVHVSLLDNPEILIALHQASGLHFEPLTQNS